MKNVVLLLVACALLGGACGTDKQAQIDACVKWGNKHGYVSKDEHAHRVNFPFRSTCQGLQNSGSLNSDGSPKDGT